MKNSLKSGLTFKFKYTVPDDKTVPFLYPEAPEFQQMPKVLATGFMVGLFEWTCIQAINPHIDWPREQTVGIGLNLNHLAATPAGLTVTVSVTLQEVDGRKLVFSIIADSFAQGGDVGQIKLGLRLGMGLWPLCLIIIALILILFLPNWKRESNNN